MDEDLVATIRLFSSNRTIVGLKQTMMSCNLVARSWQQSHHCGIETSAKPKSAKPKAQQQSHHCGIETVDEKIVRGLSLGQQLHHCGIETILCQ